MSGKSADLFNLEEAARYGMYAKWLEAAFSLQVGNTKRDDTFFIGVALNRIEVNGVKIERGGNSVFFGSDQAARQVLAFANAIAAGSNGTAIFQSRNSKTGEFNPNLLTSGINWTQRVSDVPLQVSEDRQVQAGLQFDKALPPFEKPIFQRLNFSFAPGSAQVLTYNKTEGSDVSYSVTEGISSTTSQGGSTTVTAGGSIEGKLKSFGFNASLEKSWSEEWSKSETIDFSSTKSTALSKSTTITASADLNGILPDKEGRYFYRNSSGEKIELFPAERYVLVVTEVLDELVVPFSATFNVSAKPDKPNILLDGFVEKAPRYFDKFPFGLSERFVPPFAIYDAYKKYNYDALYKGDLSQRQLVKRTNPDDLQFNVESRVVFKGADSISIDVLPVATPKPALIAQSGVSQDASSSFLLATTTSASIDAGLAIKPGLTFFLDDYNTDNGSPGVYFDVELFAEESGQATAGKTVEIVGSTGGGDYVVTGTSETFLRGFTDSTIEVNGAYTWLTDGIGAGKGEDFFPGDEFSAPQDFSLAKAVTGGNNIVIKAGSNVIEIGSAKTFVALQAGEALIQTTDTTGRLDIESRNGDEILKINSSNGDIAINNWDYRTDFLQFGGDVDLADVRVFYDQGLRDFQVFVDEDLVAVLDAKNKALPKFDSITGTFQGTRVQPFAYTGSDDQFIKTVFTAALDRLPYADELSTWQSALKSGESRNDVITDILVGDEYSAPKDNTEFAEDLYRDLLGKTPSVAEVGLWVNQLNAGESRDNLIESILTGSEFTNLFS
jgi:hypothetical protein